MKTILKITRPPLVRACLSLLIVSFFYSPLLSQSATRNLELNRLKSTFLSDGFMFSRSQNGIESGYELPKNSNKYTIYTASIWMVGIDAASNQIASSVQTYPNQSRGLFAGPVRDLTHNDDSRNGIFYQDRNQIDNFIQNHGSSGYVIPSSILNWIGNGNPVAGMANNLAPFVDLNDDQLYSPSGEGEYPLALGKKNLYFLCNDNSGQRTGININTLAFDIDLEIYAYSLEEDYAVFNDCIFLNVIISNRSQKQYRDFYTGLWFDFDIGEFTDDFAGCDSSRNLFFAYNANNMDGDYLNNAPTQAVMLLNRNLSSFVAYNNSSNSQSGLPNSPSQVYNLLKGKWKDGSAIKNAGDGTGTAGSNTNFLFNHFINQESGLGNDKRTLGSIGPFDLNPGQSLCFDMVVFPSYDEISGSTQQNLNQLFNRADTIRNAFNSYLLGCQSPFILTSLEPKNAIPSQDLKIYPNPACNYLIIEFNNPLNIKALTLSSMVSGRELIHVDVEQGSNKYDLNTSKIPSGSYLLKIETNTNSYVRKVYIRK